MVLFGLQCIYSPYANRLWYLKQTNFYVKSSLLLFLFWIFSLNITYSLLYWIINFLYIYIYMHIYLNLYKLIKHKFYNSTV